MKSVREMVYNFKLKVDKLDSKGAANIQLPAIIQLLNEGQLSLCKKRYGGLNTNYRAAFEEIQKRIDEFQRLIVPDKALKVKEVDKFIYTASITSEDKYMFMLRVSAKGSKGSCAERKLRCIREQTDDMDISEFLSYKVPSFEWGQCNYRIVQDAVRFTTDGTFAIKETKINYLRYPRDIDMTGYKHFNGDASTDVESELPYFLYPDIVDEAKFIYTSLQPEEDMSKASAKLVSNE